MAAGTAVALLALRPPVGAWWIVGVLAALAALAEQNSIKVTNRTEESISLLPTVFAAVLLGPTGGMVVGAASMLGDLIPRRDVTDQYQRWLVYSGTRSLTGAVTGFAALEANDAVPGVFASMVCATLAASVTANVFERRTCSTSDSPPSRTVFAGLAALSSYSARSRP
jgi:hypothetical protein